jgi:hypothetical protein
LALQTPSPRRLLIRDNREPLRSPLRRQSRQFSICGRQRPESQHLWLQRHLTRLYSHKKAQKAHKRAMHSACSFYVPFVPFCGLTEKAFEM